jgi:hypothetical protein
VLHRILVLAPLRVARMVWSREVAVFTPSLSVAVAVGGPAERQRALASAAQVVVANFESIDWLCDQDLRSFDGLIIDELTRFRAAGKRFKQFLKKVGGFKWRTALSGAFTAEGLRGVWAQVLIVDGGRAFGRDRGSFEREYFDFLDPNGWKLRPKPGALTAVMAKLRGLAFVLENTLYTSGLPPLITSVVRMPMAAAQRQAYVAMEADCVYDGVEAGSGGVLVQRLHQITAGFLYLADGENPKWYGTPKPEALMDLVDRLAGAPLLVLYQFQAERELLEQWLPGVPCLSGLSGAKSVQLIDAFNAGRVPVLLGHPAAMGHGIQLQFACADVCFLSLPYSFDLYDQSICRVHRSGQRQAVTVHILYCEESLDGRVWAALAGKRSFDAEAGEVLLEVAS